MNARIKSNSILKKKKIKDLKNYFDNEVKEDNLVLP